MVNRHLAGERMRPVAHGSAALNNSVLRSANECLLLNLIRERQPISRADLARSTRLMESTVSYIVKDLVERGLVSETTLGESAGGRRPRMLRLSGEKVRVLGIDVAPHRTTFGIADLNGEIHRRKTIRTSSDPDRFLKQLARETEAVAAAMARDRIALAAMGVSLPGLVNGGEGTIVYSSNLDWRDVRVGDALQRGFACDIVFDDNVRAAGLAELWFGKFEVNDAANLVVVVVDEGIGAAIFEANTPLRGSSGGAGQFGHVPIDPTGVPCRCGARGCWEAYAAEPAMLRHYRERRPREGHISADDLVRRAAAGESDAIATVRQTARYMGQGFAMIVNTINPALIVFEGALSHVWGIVEPDLLNVIRERALAPNYSSLHIRPSRIEGNSGLMGAVSLALARRFALPYAGAAAWAGPAGQHATSHRESRAE